MRGIVTLYLATFFCPILIAEGEISVAVTLASGNSNWSVIAIQPEPVPISRILRLLGLILAVAGLTPGR